MNDRIKLAEAMGWKLKPNHTGSFADKQNYQDWTSPDGVPLQQIPDPENDANDDYAVLEWMRDGGNQKDSYPFFATIEEQGRMKWDYEIGDFAIAALKVIETVDEKRKATK